MRVTGVGPVPAPGIEIHQSGKRIGELRAVADLEASRWLGLALLNLLGLDQTAPLTTAAGEAVSIIEP